MHDDASPAFLATGLRRLADSLVAEQMDLVAAGGLRIIERDVGFREQFGDPPAMRAADQGSADRGADLEVKAVPEQRPAQHRDRLLQHLRDPGRVGRRVQDDREFVAAEPGNQAGLVESLPQTLRDLAQAGISGRMAEMVRQRSGSLPMSPRIMCPRTRASILTNSIFPPAADQCGPLVSRADVRAGLYPRRWCKS